LSGQKPYAEKTEEKKVMKICVTATSNNLDAQLDPRFGRCAYLLIVDVETMQFEAIPNLASGATGGAGIQAAQTIANKGAKVLVTGNVGPNAFQALSAAGIEIVTGASGTVRDAIKKFKTGNFRKTGAPTVGGHFGMGRGRGRGRGYRYFATLTKKTVKRRISVGFCSRRGGE
jgi:predicted Fe-Mo cluster-binding NifX family protein